MFADVFCFLKHYRHAWVLGDLKLETLLVEPKVCGASESLIGKPVQGGELNILEGTENAGVLVVSANLNQYQYTIICSQLSQTSLNKFYLSLVIGSGVMI